jgi:hypothetical protein
MHDLEGVADKLLAVFAGAITPGRGWRRRGCTSIVCRPCRVKASHIRAICTPWAFSVGIRTLAM